MDFVDKLIGNDGSEHTVIVRKQHSDVFFFFFTKTDVTAYLITEFVIWYLFSKMLYNTRIKAELAIGWYTNDSDNM